MEYFFFFNFLFLEHSMVSNKYVGFLAISLFFIATIFTVFTLIKNLSGCCISEHNYKIDVCMQECM